MPKRKVTSAPWVPVPARAYTGKAPRARQHRAVGRLSAGAPRLHKSCRWRRPQSKGRSCRSGRARRDLSVRGGRGHLSERPGWPSGSPISRGSTVSMIAFGGRRGPHRSGSRCRGRPIERREAGREGCLWPNAASQGRPPDGSGGESERSTQNGRAKTLCGGGGGGGSNSELPQAGFPESGEVFISSRNFGAARPKLRLHGADFAAQRPPDERSCGRDGPVTYMSSPERVCLRVVPKGRADRDRNGQTPYARAPAGADVMPVGRVSAAPIARSLCRSGVRTTLRARGRLQAVAAGA